MPDKQHRIVVIDDELNDNFILRQNLDTAGLNCEVVEFESPIMAIEYLEAAASEKHKMPDLIITDLNMPEMGGRDLIAAIRHMPHLDNVPIVLNTAYSQEITSETAHGIGADYFFVKPITGIHIKEITILLKAV